MSGDSAHLGAALGPLVDGELTHPERERALAHLAGCPGCRGDVEAHRRLKATLSGLGGPVPRPDLAGRLLDLARAEAAAQQQSPDAPAAAGPRRSAVFAPPPPGAARTDGRRGTADRRARPAARSTRRRRGRAVAGGSGAVLVGLGAVLLLGAPRAEGPVVDPGQSRLVVEHVAVSGEVPLSTPPVGAAVTATYRR